MRRQPCKANTKGRRRRRRRRRDEVPVPSSRKSDIGWRRGFLLVPLPPYYYYYYYNTGARVVQPFCRGVTGASATCDVTRYRYKSTMHTHASSEKPRVWRMRGERGGAERNGTERNGMERNGTERNEERSPRNSVLPERLWKWYGRKDMCKGKKEGRKERKGKEKKKVEKTGTRAC